MFIACKCYKVKIGITVVTSTWRKLQKTIIGHSFRRNRVFFNQRLISKDEFGEWPFETFFLIPLIEESVTQMFMAFKEIRVVGTCSSVANQLRNVNTICRRWWYIAAQVRKINNFKIKVVSFIINFSAFSYCSYERLAI